MSIMSSAFPGRCWTWSSGAFRRSLICNEGMLARFKEEQARYFQELSLGRYEACVENQFRVEPAHRWFGLRGRESEHGHVMYRTRLELCATAACYSCPYPQTGFQPSLLGHVLYYKRSSPRHLRVGAYRGQPDRMKPCSSFRKAVPRTS